MLLSLMILDLCLAKNTITKLKQLM